MGWFDFALLHSNEISDELVDTEETFFLLQLVKAVLKRIFDVATPVIDLGISLPHLPVVFQHAKHEGEDFGIPAEDDMRTSGIERKPLIGAGAAQSSIFLLLFQYHHLMAFF